MSWQQNSASEKLLTFCFCFLRFESYTFNTLQEVFKIRTFFRYQNFLNFSLTTLINGISAFEHAAYASELFQLFLT